MKHFCIDGHPCDFEVVGTFSGGGKQDSIGKCKRCGKPVIKKDGKDEWDVMPTFHNVHIPGAIKL